MDVREKLTRILASDPEMLKNLNVSTYRLYRLIDKMITNGVTVQEWISVKEPPKKRGEYLCYFKYEPESPDVICQNTYYGSGLWMSESSRVTHWQYLPQPPKGE